MKKDKSGISRLYLEATRLKFHEHSKSELLSNFICLAFSFIKRKLHENEIESDLFIMRSANKKSEVIVTGNSRSIIYDKYQFETLFSAYQVQDSTNPSFTAASIALKYLAEHYFIVGDRERSKYWGNVFIELSDQAKQFMNINSRSMLKIPIIQTFVLFHESAHIFIILDEYKEKVESLRMRAREFINESYSFRNILFEKLNTSGNFLSGEVASRNNIFKNKHIDHLVDEMICDAISIENSLEFYFSAKKRFLLPDVNKVILLTLANMRWFGKLKYFISRKENRSNFGNDFLHDDVRMHWAKTYFSDMLIKYPELKNFYRFNMAREIQWYNSIFTPIQERILGLVNEFEELDEKEKHHVFDQYNDIELPEILDWSDFY